MTDPTAVPGSRYRDDGQISLFAIASVILRWQWQIMTLAVLGFVFGLVSALSKPRVYMSSAPFIPETSQGGTSGLALAASQFGFNIPSAGGAGVHPCTSS